MQTVWNSNRVVLFSTLVLLFLFRLPALAGDAAVDIGKQVRNCSWHGVTCRDGEVTTINLIGATNVKGPFPNLSGLASLTNVYLDSNQFTSYQKGSLSGLTSLTTFSVDNNPIGDWDVFRDLGKDSSQLNYFSAHNASLAGPIPDIIGSFRSLQTLKLSYNQIEGPLPASLAGSVIQTLWLNNQQMSGTIDVIASMKSAQQLWLHANDFSGPIPDFKRNLSGVELQLRDNKLTGLVPNSLNFPNLTLTLSKNLFQGPMPSFVNKTELNYTGMDMFCTGTSGDPCAPQVTILLQIASLFGYPLGLVQNWKGNDPCSNHWSGIFCTLGQVTVINFANHNLSGTIDSPVFGSLTSLTNLTLMNNNLSGPIPQSLAKLPDLESLDVSNNNLSGIIPPFGSNVTVNTTGNPWIGKVLSPPPGSSSPSSGANKPWATAVVVVSVIIIAAAVVGFCVYKRSSKKKRLEAYKRPSQLSDSEVYTSGVFGGSRQLSSQVSIDISDGSMKMDDLIQVTDNFSEAKVIGRGGFGTVYRGKLTDGREVAVKRMVAPVFMSSKGMAEYKAEIDVLSEVKHRNLVGLIGFCANGNERILVYEFMPQGTLGDHLFDWRQRGGQPLSWSQRAAIALDVARGVDYLHSHAGQSFIHRDLKPNNILLGDDMRAKVADFGLVKNAGNASESIQTKVAGTFGYFAPEYWETGRVTTKVDVYAFGVILLEIISGRKVVDDSEDAIDGGNLMLRFRRIIAGKEDVRGHIDPTLNADDDEETYRNICKVVELAGHCTVGEPQRRCDMRHAVHVLSSLVEQWTPSSSDVPTTFGMEPGLQLPNLVEQWKAGNGMSSASYTYT